MRKQNEGSHFDGEIQEGFSEEGTLKLSFE